MSLILNPDYKPVYGDFIIISDLTDAMIHILLSSHPEWFSFSDDSDLRKDTRYLEWFMSGFCRTDYLEGNNHHITTDVIFVDSGYQTAEESAMSKLLELGYVWDDKSRVWLSGSSAAWIHGLSDRI